MNILYIIGNGLDIACDLKTSYQDFFKYYLSISTKDDDISFMKKNIDEHKYDNWSDLEIGLGIYSKNCLNKEIFFKCLDDIKESLKEYLKNESKKIDNIQVRTMSRFIQPEKLLELEPRARFNKFLINKAPFRRINVITFNYTQTFEHLTNYNNRVLNLTEKSSLDSVFHIHGLLNDAMVMGVNDSSQISNFLFNKDEDVIEEFVKPEYNDACLNNKNATGEALIAQADIIIIYGASLGLSDDKWWKIIGQRMESNSYPLLVYLPYDEKKDLSATPNHLRRWTKRYVTEIKRKFYIQLDEEKLSDRICISINKKLLDTVNININN